MLKDVKKQSRPVVGISECPGDGNTKTRQCWTGQRHYISDSQRSPASKKRQARRSSTLRWQSTKSVLNRSLLRKMLARAAAALRSVSRDLDGPNLILS